MISTSLSPSSVLYYYYYYYYVRPVGCVLTAVVYIYIYKCKTTFYSLYTIYNILHPLVWDIFHSSSYFFFFWSSLTFFSPPILYTLFTSCRRSRAKETYFFFPTHTIFFFFFCNTNLFCFTHYRYCSPPQPAPFSTGTPPPVYAITHKWPSVMCTSTIYADATQRNSRSL